MVSFFFLGGGGGMPIILKRLSFDGFDHLLGLHGSWNFSGQISGVHVCY